MSQVSKKDAILAKRSAVAILKEYGIEEPFTIRVKKFERHRKDWLGLYRSGIWWQVIIWINQELPTMLEEQGVPSELLGEVIL